MIQTSIAGVVEAVSGKLLAGDRSQKICGVTTDSRQARPGQLFFALHGENHDGHEFAGQAVTSGATGIVLSRPVSLPQNNAAVILVPDTLAALQALAGYHRSGFSMPVVGVTGSTGKTTTKDMIAAVLGEKGPVLKTGGNFNNEIGLPLTLLNLGPEHWAAIVEMGMRGLGEIEQLCRISLPNIGVITNIGLTHIERLGSPDNIARAKGELLESLGADGTAVLNGDDPWLRRLGDNCRCRVVYYGLDEGNDVKADAVCLKPDGAKFTVWVKPGSTGLPQAADINGMPVRLSVPGRHNIANALAAVAVGAILGLDGNMISRGLENLTLSGMRLEVVTGCRSTSIINDSYNANPASVKAALGVLAQNAGGERIAVLGDMLELGDWAAPAHRQIGEEAARLGIDRLITVGKLAQDIAAGAAALGMEPRRISICDSNQEAAALVKEILQPGNTVLVKGSRGMKMEEIVEALRDS